jgi:DNA polymerase-3 subunit beta
MHITVNRREFASAFRWAYGGLPKYATVPVLFGMRLTVEDRTLTLSVFDYEQSRRGWLSGTNTEAGQVLVSGTELKKVISSLPPGNRVTVDISADESALTLTSQGITWMLPALPDEDYPGLPDLPRLAGVADGYEFARAIGRVAPAVSRDDEYPVLRCIRCEAHPAALTLAATDRYRVALDRISWTPADPGAPRFRANVPAQGLDAYAKQAGKFGKVAIHLSDELAGFHDDARELTVRTLAGVFPPYRRVLRAESPVHLMADSKALAAVVERMGKVSEKRPATGDLQVALVYAKNALTVQALSRDDEVRASETLAAEAEGAAELEVRFNPVYLWPMLQGIDGKAVIGLAGDLLRNPKPATIHAGTTDTFTAVVVPARKTTEDPEPA